MSLLFGRKNPARPETLQARTGVPAVTRTAGRTFLSGEPGHPEDLGEGGLRCRDAMGMHVVAPNLLR
jgi:hypothetical protein